jgi:ankyrin repeat protein
MHAVMYGQEAVVRVLVEAGAPLDSTDASGMTALMHACLTRQEPIKMVRLLMRAGASLHLTTHGEDKLEAIVRGLVETHPRGWLVHGWLSCLKLKGEDLTGGRTALMLAAMHEDDAVIRALLEEHGKRQ